MTMPAPSDAPVRPVAYATPDELRSLAGCDGQGLTALYALTAEEVAEVNKLRARGSWKMRPMHECRCDHNEYCGHCWPESFRPGGVWYGLRT
jgi:hypothetical protein